MCSSGSRSRGKSNSLLLLLPREQIPWQEQKQAIVLTNHWQQSSGGQQLNLDGVDQLPLGYHGVSTVTSAPGRCPQDEGVGFPSQLLKQLIHSPAVMGLGGRGRCWCASFSSAHSRTSWPTKWIPWSLLMSMGVLYVVHPALLAPNSGFMPCSTTWVGVL